MMAGNAIESQLRKKHYYKLSSNQKKGKIGEFNHVKSKVGEGYLKNSNKGKANVQPFKGQAKRPIYNQTTSKSFFIQISKPSKSQKKKTISHIVINKKQLV